MMTEAMTAPRVPAYPDGRGGLRTWCPWCDRWHYHGPRYGHRSAHCHKAPVALQGDWLRAHRPDQAGGMPLNREEYLEMLATKPATRGQRGAIMGEFARLGVR